MTAKSTKPRPSSTRSPRSARRRPSAEVLEFQRFCAELRNADGSPFSLYPEQLEIVQPYFDGARESIVIVPKKNGKSTLVAALALYHLLITPDADCIIVAAARDQAEIILNQARKFIRRSSGLQARMRVLRREINSLDDSGRVRVLASDEDTADGQLPTLAIVDELHRHRTDELYTTLRLAIGTTGGRMVTISTAGATMNSPLGHKRQRALEMPGFVRDPKRRRSFVRSADGAFAFIEWSLNPDDDPLDMKIVKKVNPAPWKTLALLEEERESVTPWQWLRFGCGIWTEGEEPWCEPAKWDGLAEPSLELEAGVPTTLAVGLGLKGESGAILKLQVNEGVVTAKAEIMSRTSLEKVVWRLRELVEELPVTKLVYGAKIFRTWADILEGEGVPVEEHPLTPERMVPASGTLYELVEEGKLRHDGDPELRAQVLAGREKKTENGWRFVQDPMLPRPIDALIALAIGCHTALSSPPSSPFVAVGWV